MDGNEHVKRAIASLLQRAMGGNTAKEFAEKAGVSRYQVSRILNEKLSSMPSINTLNRIANASEGRVSLDDMVMIFRAGKEAKKGDRYERLGRTVLEELKMRSGTARSYSSLESFFAETLEQQGLTLECLQVETGKPRAIDQHMNAEHYANIVLKWKGMEKTGTEYFTLFYTRTQGKRVIICETSDDLPTLQKYNHLEAQKMRGGEQSMWNAGIWMNNDEIHYLSTSDLEKYEGEGRNITKFSSSGEAKKELKRILEKETEYTVFAGKFEANTKDPRGDIDIVAVKTESQIPEGYEGPFYKFEIALFSQKLKRSEKLLETVPEEE